MKMIFVVHVNSQRHVNIGGIFCRSVNIRGFRESLKYTCTFQWAPGPQALLCVPCQWMLPWGILRSWSWINSALLREVCAATNLMKDTVPKRNSSLVDESQVETQDETETFIVATFSLNFHQFKRISKFQNGSKRKF